MKGLQVLLCCSYQASALSFNIKETVLEFVFSKSSEVLFSGIYIVYLTIGFVRAELVKICPDGTFALKEAVLEIIVCLLNPVNLVKRQGDFALDGGDRR